MAIATRPPVRAAREYTQRIDAAPEAVFPLLCPVREHDWIEGWRTDFVISESGLAEEGCVFQTPGDEGQPPATWVVTLHDPSAHEVAMVKLVPGHTVTRLAISLESDSAGHTRARVRYEWTALSPAGEEEVARWTEQAWRAFMHAWEEALNAWFARGGAASVG